MGLLTITELKPGRAVVLDGEPFIVVSSQFGRKSQSKANMQCKLRNLKNGSVVARNFQGSETIEPADVGYRRVQYLYKDATGYGFMDLQTYDQFSLSEEIIGDAGKYLVEGGEVDALVFDEKPIAIELKSTVELKVIETSPGVRGDTATGGNKAAVLESGLQVNVPLFINEGDKLKINTETGAYMSRAE
jgi:elongation factor P